MEKYCLGSEVSGSVEHRGKKLVYCISYKFYPSINFSPSTIITISGKEIAKIIPKIITACSKW